MEKTGKILVGHEVMMKRRCQSGKEQEGFTGSGSRDKFGRKGREKNRICGLKED